METDLPKDWFAMAVLGCRNKDKIRLNKRPDHEYIIKVKYHTSAKCLPLSNFLVKLQ